MSEAEESRGRRALLRFNPGGVVYGVLALSTVIAAESTRRETYPKLIVASGVTLLVYWLAHAYAHHWASRLQGSGRWTVREALGSFRHEASIIVGAAVPAAVLLIAWAAGASIETAVTIDLWIAGFELLALEVAVGLVHRFKRRELLYQTLVGLGMGLGVLVLRLVLH